MNSLVYKLIIGLDLRIMHGYNSVHMYHSAIIFMYCAVCVAAVCADLAK